MATWSEFDLNAYNARQAAANHRKGDHAPNCLAYVGGGQCNCKSSKGCDDESELHQQIQQECKRRGWMTFHGSMAHSTFRTPGEPDFVILCDGGKLLMIECKTRTGKLSPDQLAIHAWATRLSHVVHTVRSMEEFYQLTKPPHDNTNATTSSESHHVRD